ncbi:hypothetical protein J6590_062649 [Homalodisca vitripennis]|nr:hypothetical protein J6590_062649 [Homalodisca vitripennis]
MYIYYTCRIYAISVPLRGAKSAHENGQGAELGPPYSKGVLIQGLDTPTGVLIQAHRYTHSGPAMYDTPILTRISTKQQLWPVCVRYTCSGPTVYDAPIRG